MVDEEAKVQAGSQAAAQQTAAPEEHYEEVSEYRIGEGPPPLPLIISFVLIVIWATIAWIPFFGY